MQLRAKSFDEAHYRKLAEQALSLCNRYDAQLLLNAAPQLAQATEGNPYNPGGADWRHVMPDFSQMSKMSSAWEPSPYNTSPPGKIDITGGSAQGEILKSQLGEHGANYYINKNGPAAGTHFNTRGQFDDLIDRHDTPMAKKLRGFLRNPIIASFLDPIALKHLPRYGDAFVEDNMLENQQAAMYPGGDSRLLEVMSGAQAMGMQNPFSN